MPHSDDKSLEADAAEVFDVMTELLRIYQFRDRERANAYGVTVTQSYALGVIVARGEVTAKELAYELALDKSTVSRLVDTMVENGLVERVSHPDDARSVLLRATPLGRRLRAAGKRDIVRENAEALRGLTAAERASFIDTLKRFTDAARRRIRGEGVGAG